MGGFGGRDPTLDPSLGLTIDETLPHSLLRENNPIIYLIPMGGGVSSSYKCD